MKWVVIVICLLLTSCMELVFKEAMPLAGIDIKEFPIELQGTFVSNDDANDTVRIDRNSVTDVRFNLDSGNVLRNFGKYYVCNQKWAGGWNIALVKMNGRNGFSLYTFDIEDTKNRNRIESITKTEEIKDEEGRLDYLLISPTDEEFHRLIKSKALVRDEKFRRIKE